MTDSLERILVPGRDLVDRVDGALLAAGAPSGHPIWPLLRRVGALPGDAVDSVAALRPDAVEASAADVRALAEECARRHAAIADAADWTGPAAESFGARWRQLDAYLGTAVAVEEPSVAGRLAATAGYLDDVARWMRSARGQLATTLATVLTSAEAVRLRAGPTLGGPPRPDVLAAAAGIAARVLDSVATAHDDGIAVPQRWASRLGELVYRPVVEPDGLRQGGATTVRL